jgi:tetratricopeptide (TPR) repeat protein
MGIVVTAQGQPDEAQALYQESLNLSDQFDDARTAAAALFGLGLLAFERGTAQRGVAHSQVRPPDANDLALAQNYLQASAQAAKDCGDDVILLRALNGLGELARVQGKLDAASANYGESLRLSEQLGHRWGQAAALHNLGYVCKAQGDVAQSLAHFRQGLTLYRDLDEERGIAECLIGIGCVLAECDENDEMEAARHLLAAAKLILHKLGARLTAVEQHAFDQAAERLGLGGSEFVLNKPRAKYAQIVEQSIEIAQQE